MSHDRSLAAPQFPGDDGTIDPVLAAAFGDDVAVLQALPDVRVFVPIVALLGDVPAEGDKNADMAAVLMTGADGRQALLAFSSVAAMAAWDPQARPVPILGKDAAQATLDEGAAAILLDLANPTFTVVETDDVQHLAHGHRLVRSAVGVAWVS
ncbi:MAG: SseB family protein [Aeromicrobium sp.]